MAKVEIHPGVPTPSEKIVKSSQKVVEIEDQYGRKIRLKRPGPLDRLDFKKASGGDKLNILYFAEVSHLEYVCGIDGDTVDTPCTELQLRALYQRLDEANELCQKVVAEHFLSATPEVIGDIKK